jgi:hypothetical protein
MKKGIKLPFKKLKSFSDLKSSESQKSEEELKKQNQESLRKIYSNLIKNDA